MGLVVGYAELLTFLSVLLPVVVTSILVVAVLVVSLGDATRVGSATTIVEVPIVKVWMSTSEYDKVELGSAVIVLMTV